MTESREIQDAILKLAGTFGLRLAEIMTGEVTAVAEEDGVWTCTVSCVIGEDGEYTVSLSPENNDGFIQIPALESTIIFAKMPNGEKYALAFSDIARIVCVIDGSNKYEFSTTGFIFNGGTFGGLIKIDNLKTQWDANVAATKSAIQAALTVIDTQLATLGQPGGSLTAFNTAATSIANFNKTTAENTKIKH